MRQTESAMRMLICAYRAVLSNCFNKEFLRGGVKRLAKSAALGSFLTSFFAISSNISYAEPIITDTVTSDVLTLVGNSIINVTDKKEPAIHGTDESINITVEKDESIPDDQGNLTLEVGETHGVIAELENKEDQIGIGVAGDLIINVKGDDTDKTGDGINVSNTNLGSINITAGNSNFIKATSAHGDGIKVESGKTLSDAAEIKLTASLGNNVISSGNNGIDHGGAQMILLDAKNGINKIITIAKKSASENKEMTGDGIRIGTAEKEHALPNGKVVLEAQSNIIDAEDAGLNNSGSKQAVIDVTATVGPNIISGEKEAVLLNGSGSIIVKAQNDNSGISLLTEIGDDDYYNKHTNIFGGGENGIHAAADSDGNFTAIADENNYISGSVNGIWTEDSSGTGPTITIEAGRDNIIGFTGKVSDSDGEILEGTIGQNGINVSSGSVTLTAGNDNKIYATDIGIKVQDGFVSLTAGNDISINAVGSQDSTAILMEKDISSLEESNVTLSAQGNIVINADDLNTAQGLSKGIMLDCGNQNGYGDNQKLLYVDIDATGDFIIGSEKESNFASSGIQVDTYAGTVDVDANNVYMNIEGDTLIGATESGHINITAQKDINLYANSNSYLVMGYIQNRNNQYVTKRDEDKLVGINGIRESNVTLKASGAINLVVSETNQNNYMNIGIFATGTRGNVDGKTPVLTGDNNKNKDFIDENGYVYSHDNITSLKASQINISINNKYGIATGILAQHSDKVSVNLTSSNGINLYTTSEQGVGSIAIDTADGNVNLTSEFGSNNVSAVAESASGQGIGIQVESEEDYVNYVYKNRVYLTAAENNSVFGTTTSIYNTGSDSIVGVTAKLGQNYLSTLKGTVIDANNYSQTDVVAETGNNYLYGGDFSELRDDTFGEFTTVKATTGAKVKIQADEGKNLVVARIAVI